MHIFYFTPKDGRFNFEKSKIFKDLPNNLRSLRHVMTIKEYRENRSNEQNAYMWGVVYKLMEDTGYTSDEIHQLMGKKFLQYEKNGRVFVKSTKSLNTKQMEEYLAKVRQFASIELGIYIPLPNETHFLEDL